MKLGAVCLAALVLSPAAGLAARKPAAVPGEAAYQDAMRAFKAGQKDRARGLFEVALADLPPGHALYAKTLYNLAYLADGEVDAGEVGAACRAQKAYERYLDALGPDDPEHTRTRAQAQTRREALFERCEAERAPVVAVPVTTVESAPEPRPAWMLPTAAIGAGVGLAAGVALQFWAQSALDLRDRAHDRYLEVSDAKAAAREKRNAETAQADAEQRVLFSYVAFGVGAALAATTTWLWLTEPEETAAPSAALVVGPGGLHVRGSF